MPSAFVLFLIIFIEGYVVLAAEMLAIRQVVPFVGSGIEITAIIISAVLLPLAVGYHQGGRALKDYAVPDDAPNDDAPVENPLMKTQRLQGLLVSNMAIALAFLCFGLSYFALDLIFRIFHDLGIRSYMAQAGLYALIFLVTPMYALGQTVPLVSNFFASQRLSAITGKMLFFSTAGAFVGSLLSTLVLMTYFGVHAAVAVTLALIALLGVMTGGRRHWGKALTCVVIAFFGAAINNGNFLGSFYNMVADNAYNTTRIMQEAGSQTRILNLNNSLASTWNPDPEKRAAYIAYIDRNFIKPTLNANQPPREILVIGAGGFVLGHDDKHNAYTFVDIDGSLKDIAEKKFLPEPLTPNKAFTPASARAFVHNDTKQYDLIVIDVFSMVNSIPQECTTVEFLRDVKARLKQGGAVVANVVTSPIFADVFSVRYDRTFSSVFPVHARQVIQDFSPWPGTKPSSIYANVLYIAYANGITEDPGLYTDDKNTYSLDKPQQTGGFF